MPTFNVVVGSDAFLEDTPILWRPNRGIDPCVINIVNKALPKTGVVAKSFNC